MIWQYEATTILQERTMKLNTANTICFSADPHGMNWLRENMPYA